MDQELVDAAARSWARLTSLQRDVLRLLDLGREVPVELQTWLEEAERTHDEAAAALMRYVEGR